METALPGCKQRSLNQLTEVAYAESCVVLYHGIFIDLTKSRTFRAILFILTHISCSFSDLQIVEVFASVCKCLSLVVMGSEIITKEILLTCIRRVYGPFSAEFFVGREQRRNSWK